MSSLNHQSFYALDPDQKRVAVSAGRLGLIQVRSKDFPPDLLRLFDEVCQAHKVTRIAMLGSARTQKMAKARAEFWHRAFYELGMSPTVIGRFCLNERTTVMHGIKRHAAYLEQQQGGR